MLQTIWDSLSQESIDKAVVGVENGCKHVLELMEDILKISSNQQTKPALFRATSK